MKKIVVLILCVLGLLAKLTALSSIPLPVNIQSPNAANLGSYGQFSVSEYTGVPNISIPLMDLTAGPLKLDVSMSYDASGIRINSHPSWVGQNWALNAGGVIMRSIQGYEDECPNGIEYCGGDISQVCTKAGFFTTHNTYYLKNDETIYYRNENIKMQYIINNRRDYCNYDLEPDIFTFNFMGKIGRFFMGNDGEWKVQSDCNLQVIFYNDVDSHDSYQYLKSGPSFSLNTDMFKHNNVTINGFRMRDDEGFIYVFGFDENAIEYSIDFFNQLKNGDNEYMPSRWRSNAWYLSKVYDRYGNLLFSFDYERGTFIAEFFEYSENIDCDENYSSYFSFPEEYHEYSVFGSTNTFWRENICLGGNLISPVYLKNIYNVPNNQSLLFISSKSSERPYINFPYYHYFGPPISNPFCETVGSVGTTFPINTITDYKYRSGAHVNNNSIVYPYLQLLSTAFVETEGRGEFLQDDPILGLRWRKLDAIHLVSGYGCINPDNHVKSVRITYNDGVANQTDRLIPTKVDYEYNNKDFFNIVKDPEYSYIFQYYGNIGDVKKYLNRTIDDWGYDGGNTNGILRLIKYPTGGSTIFSYERNYAHSYVDGLSTSLYDGYVGGLRTESITNYKGSDIFEKVTKTYSYINGILNAKPQYNYAWEANFNMSLIQTFHNYYYVDYELNNYSITPILPLSNHSGKFIEYPKIIETITNNSSIPECITEYSFISYESNSNELTEGFNDPTHKLTDRSFARGKLLKKKVRTQSHVEVTEYTYRDITNYIQFVEASNYNTTIMYFSTLGVLGLPTGCNYKIYYGDYDIIEEKVEKFRLDNLNNPISSIIKKYNRKDFSKSILYNYPNDQTSSNVSFRLLESDEELKSDGNYIKTVYHYPFNEDDNYSYLSNQDVLDKLLYKYFYLKPVAITTLNNNTLLYKKEWKFDDFNEHILPSAWYKSMNNGNFSLPDISYLGYDNFGNLLSYKDKSGMYGSIIWDRMLMKPSVHIKNMNYSTLLGLIGQDGINVFGFRNYNYLLRLDYLNTLRGIGKNVSVEYYEYSSMGNLTRKILPNGLGYEYQYDDVHRLSEINTLNGLSLEKYEYNYR